MGAPKIFHTTKKKNKSPPQPTWEEDLAEAALGLQQRRVGCLVILGVDVCEVEGGPPVLPRRHLLAEDVMPAVRVPAHITGRLSERWHASIENSVHLNPIDQKNLTLPFEICQHVVVVVASSI